MSPRPRKEGGEPIPGVAHGTSQGYKAGCKCRACLDYNSNRHQAWLESTKKRAESGA